MKKRKKKVIELPQKFNPGIMKYESELPLKRIGRKPKIKVDRKAVILVIISLFILLTLFFIALKRGIF